MTPLFSDENVPFPLVEALRQLSYDILTTLAAGLANKQTPDSDILSYATQVGRAVLTNNRWDFHALHGTTPRHGGIVTFTDDSDIPGLAQRIDAAIVAAEPLAGKLVKVVRAP
jgi:hypothetical protein